MHQPKFVLTTCLFLIGHVVLAQQIPEDENIIISRKVQSFTYKLEGKSKPIIEETTSTVYECTKYQSYTTVCESYNPIVSLDKVAISSKTKQQKPEYQRRKIEGIFYSDEMLCLFNLMFSKKGETAEVLFKKTFRDPRYFTTVYFPEHLYVSQATVEIVIPRWMKVEVLEMNFGGQITKHVAYDAKRDAAIYTYETVNLKAIKHEENAPGSSYIHPHLLILNKYAVVNGQKEVYFNTLEDQYAWYRSILAQTSNDKEKVREAALHITRSCTSEEDKLKAVYEWVQANVRYIAFEDGIAAFKPDAAQNVLEKKYGDCKGMANLLKELLVALGFDARLCWLGTKHIAYDYLTPCLANDNHMVCALFLNGKMMFLDATVKYIALGQYHESIQGRQVLVEDGEKFILSKIPEASPEQNTTEDTATFEINDGKLLGSVKVSYAGESKNLLLGAINATMKNRRNEALINLLSQGSKQYAISDLNIGDLSGSNKSLSISYNVSNTSGISSYGNQLFIDPDFDKELADSKIDTLDRAYDYLFPYKYHMVKKVTVAVPNGYVVESVPATFSVENENYAFRISYTHVQNQLHYHKELTIRNPLLAKESFQKWNGDIDSLRNAYLKPIVLSKNTN